MTLIVNGKSLEVPKNSNADDLITQLGYQNQRIALEVNEVIIPRSNYTKFILNADDKIEIIKAVGGG